MTQKNDKTVTNGKAVVSATKPELSNVQVSAKVDEKVKEEVKSTLTFNQRMEKVKNLSALLDKHEKYVESRDKLNQFKLSADEHTGKLSIADNHGSSFITSNPVIVNSVMDLIKNIADTQIRELEEQINF